jgi:hypothetical protein
MVPTKDAQDNAAQQADEDFFMAGSPRGLAVQNATLHVGSPHRWNIQKKFAEPTAF